MVNPKTGGQIDMFLLIQNDIAETAIFHMLFHSKEEAMEHVKYLDKEFKQSEDWTYEIYEVVAQFDPYTGEQFDRDMRTGL